MLINLRHLKKYNVTKADKKRLPEEILKRVKAYSDELKEVYPSSVFVSNVFYKTLESNVKKAFKKENPYLKSKKLKLAVAMHMLNYGPNTSLGSVLNDDVILVDLEGINKTVALHKSFDEEEALFNDEPPIIDNHAADATRYAMIGINAQISAEEIVKLETEPLINPEPKIKLEDPSFFDGTFLSALFKAFSGR